MVGETDGGGMWCCLPFQNVWNSCLILVKGGRVLEPWRPTSSQSSAGTEETCWGDGRHEFSCGCTAARTLCAFCLYVHLSVSVGVVCPSVSVCQRLSLMLLYMHQMLWTHEKRQLQTQMHVYARTCSWTHIV